MSDLSLNYKNYKVLKEVAKDFFESKAIPENIKNSAQLLMIMQAGYDIGLSPTQAMNGMYIVNGKITVYGETAILLMKKAGYKIEVLESTSKIAKVKVKDSVSQEFEYTIEEAMHAGLTTGKKGIWQKYPRQMLLYKAFAFARKFFAPDCLGGYLIKEEMDGETVEKEQGVSDEEAMEGFSANDNEDG